MKSSELVFMLYAALYYFYGPLVTWRCDTSRSSQRAYLYAGLCSLYFLTQYRRVGFGPRDPPGQGSVFSQYIIRHFTTSQTCYSSQCHQRKE